MTNFYSEKIELAPIACLIKQPNLYSVVKDSLKPKSFVWHSFITLFELIQRLNKNDIIADKSTIIAELERTEELSKMQLPSLKLSGRDVIDYLYETEEVIVDNIDSYAQMVQNMYATRQLDLSLERARRKLEDTSESPSPINVLAQLDIDTGKIATLIGAKSRNMIVAKDVAKKVIEEFKEASEGRHLYISTRLDAWDDFTNGLFNGRLYVVAAVSNDGKSSLVQNILYNISVASEENKNPVKGCLISLESSATEVFRKLIQRITGISSLDIEAGNVPKDKLDDMKNAVKQIGESEIVFDESSELILPVLRTKIRKAVQDGAKYVVIDQLEQIAIGGAADSQPDYLKLNAISYRIKAFAREENIPIILVHQMNRSIDSGQNRGKNLDPQIQDLAQAGEKAADAVMMIRHKKVKGVIVESTFWWVKNRQGKKGFRRVDFNGEFVRFKDIAGQSEFTDDMPPEYQDEEDEYEEQPLLV